MGFSKVVHQQIRFVTSFSASGFEYYGRNMVESFERAQLGALAVYSEDELPRLPYRCRYHNLHDVEGFDDFLERHHDNQEARGNVEHESWRKKEREAGHSFRTDAYKFFRKTYAIYAEAQRVGNGVLVWMDGDSLIHSKPRDGWMEELILKDADVAYLGREGYHSECGFLAFRLPAATPFIERWRGWYADDLFLGRESHDSKLFDDTRPLFPNLNFRDISPPGRRTGHVWHKSMLKHWFWHLKGKEKDRATHWQMVVSRRGTTAAGRG